MPIKNIQDSKKLDDYIIEAADAVNVNSIEPLFADIYQILERYATELNTVMDVVTPDAVRNVKEYLVDNHKLSINQYPSDVIVTANLCLKSDYKLINIYYDFENKTFKNQIAQNRLAFGKIKIGFVSYLYDTSIKSVRDDIITYLLEPSKENLARFKLGLVKQIKKFINNSLKTLTVNGVETYINNCYLRNKVNPFKYGALPIELFDPSTAINLALGRGRLNTAQKAVECPMYYYLEQVILENINNEDFYDTILYQQMFSTYINDGHTCAPNIRDAIMHDIAKSWVKNKVFVVEPDKILYELDFEKVADNVIEPLRDDFIKDFYSSLSKKAQEMIISSLIGTLLNLELVNLGSKYSFLSYSVRYLYKYVPIEAIQTKLNEEYNVNFLHHNDDMVHSHDLRNFAVSLASIEISELADVDLDGSIHIVDAKLLNLKTAITLNLRFEHDKTFKFGLIGIKHILSTLNKDKNLLAVLNKADIVAYTACDSVFLTELKSPVVRSILEPELIELADLILSKASEVRVGYINYSVIRKPEVLYYMEGQKISPNFAIEFIK